MEITSADHDGVTILTLVGKLALSGGAKALYTATRKELDRGRKRILLNLPQVSFIDSTGLGELISCLTSASTRDAVLKLLSPSPKVEDVLRITDTYKLFEIYFDEDEAIRSFLETDQ